MNCAPTDSVAGEMSAEKLAHALFHGDSVEVGCAMQEAPDAVLDLIDASASPAENARQALLCLRAKVAHDYANSEEQLQEQSLRALLDRLACPDTYTDADMQLALQILESERARKEAHLNDLHACLAEQANDDVGTEGVVEVWLESLYDFLMESERQLQELDLVHTAMLRLRSLHQAPEEESAAE